MGFPSKHPNIGALGTLKPYHLGTWTPLNPNLLGFWRVSETGLKFNVEGLGCSLGLRVWLGSHIRFSEERKDPTGSCIAKKENKGGNQWIYWGYIGVYIGIMENKMEATIVYWGNIGIMEKKMETSISSTNTYKTNETVFASMKDLDWIIPPPSNCP